MTSINTSKDDFSHYSVMADEAIELLNIRPDGIYVDLTTGGGGHSERIVSRLESGRLICVDEDMTAIEASKLRLAPYAEKITFVHANFTTVEVVLDNLGIPKIDGAIADLGVSSFQLDCAERGFSYMKDAPLDMRMDESSPVTAYDIVNGKSEEELKRILYEYGEESFAPSIARKIVKYREEKNIETTLELVDVIKSAMPAKAKEGGHHPAKRSFQAIRIAVNGELDAIAPTVRAVIGRLAPQGRFAVITFHSLEDRLVKTGFAEAARGCICPPEFPVCVCGKKPLVKLITRKPVIPSARECSENPRSRSAKLRVCEKL